MIKRILWVFISLLILSFFCMVYNNRKITNEVLTEMQYQWAAWEKFEKEQCTLVEKTYGMTVTAGKSTMLENSHVYKCHGGTQYILTGTALERIQGCLKEQKFCSKNTLKLVPKP